jgi:hypothetical protein
MCCWTSPAQSFSGLSPAGLSDSTLESESESHVTTDGQPASLSRNKAPFWGLRPDLYYCLTVAGLLIWGVLSDDRTGLSFTCCWPSPAQSFSGPSPEGLGPLITVSDSRLPFSSPPTTRRVTMEVFDPASTRVRVPLL